MVFQLMTKIRQKRTNIPAELFPKQEMLGKRLQHPILGTKLL